MDRISLAFARVCFFVMLFISTACNKMDRSLLQNDLVEASPAAVSQPAADPARLRVLEGRVAMLEAELKAVNSEARASLDIPGGANWD